MGEQRMVNESPGYIMSNDKRKKKKYSRKINLIRASRNGTLKIT